MRIHTHRWLTLSALLASAALVVSACVTKDDEGSPASNAGGEAGTGGGGTGGGGTGGGPAGTGGGGLAGTGGGGTGGTTAGAAGTAGQPPTAGTAGGGAVAGGGGATAGTAGAPPAGAGGAAGSAGVQCVGDDGTAPDCTSLDGYGAPCPGAGGAGGAGGAAAGDPALGPDLCAYYGTEWRLGPRQAFHACVAGITEAPCSDAYNGAVAGCEDYVSNATCESSNAATLCAGIDCSGADRLGTGECEWVLSPYVDDSQNEIITCYNGTGEDGTDTCDDALYGCI